MPEVSFYILSSASEQERCLFVCKLAEKAYRNGAYMYLQTASEEQNRLLDDLLWTFRAGSFIPHQIHNGEVPANANRIMIGTGAAPQNWQKIIVNLSPQAPDNLEQAERILEILNADENIKQAGRQRYRHYQQLQLAISTHKMNN